MHCILQVQCVSGVCVRTHVSVCVCVPVCARVCVCVFVRLYADDLLNWVLVCPTCTDAVHATHIHMPGFVLCICFDLLHCVNQICSCARSEMGGFFVPCHHEWDPLLLVIFSSLVVSSLDLRQSASSSPFIQNTLQCCTLCSWVKSITFYLF